VAGDLSCALAAAVRSRSARFRYGTTHAFGALADWLELLDEQTDPERRLVCALEPLAYIARDTLRHPAYPFAEGAAQGTSNALLDELVSAIDAEDEAAASRALRGALASGASSEQLERAFSRAALLHYADFGHSLIYTDRTFRGLEILGWDLAEALLLPLVRSIVFASREDHIPEFRAYAASLAAFGAGSRAAPTSDAFAGLGIQRALDLVVDHSQADAGALFDALFAALTEQLYRFDVAAMHRTDNALADNVSWLDVTHGLTFSVSVWSHASRFPELWAPGLLQMACFLGRNAKYQDHSLADPSPAADSEAMLAAAIERVFDHGQAEPIVSAHLIKVVLAARRAFRAGLRPPALLASVERFSTTPLKGRHVLRTARQARHFVSRE
jgi:hypothetical protein